MQAELVALRVLQHHREVIEPFLLEHTNAGEDVARKGDVAAA
jgi:hypothetical protein